MSRPAETIETMKADVETLRHVITLAAKNNRASRHSAVEVTS